MSIFRDRILLLGANGQVGRELHLALAGRDDVVLATRSGLLADGTPCLTADLADEASLARALVEARATTIINAAAYTAVDRAEDEPELADRVNHRAVGEIGAWAAAHGACVVHYSTDYVFDGHGITGADASPRAYREDDATAPLGAYGRSKLAGEQVLAASGASHRIFRTAWVYASHGHNFLRTMLRLAAEREELRVVADQVGAPTPARWIAEATVAVLAQGGDVSSAAVGDGGTRRFAAASHPTAHPTALGSSFGVFNLVAGGRCSWYEFASAIVDGAAARGLITRAPRVVPIASADFPTRARRPAWSVLDGARLKAAFGLQLPDWRAGLDQVLDELARAGPA
ncbi:MAG: dTDP-4-dehydrorhamnose reductase [Dokdonella sp.]|uniref:dTDP-4-dehydrorhamnose reductase n=1 Tax=Dokdonella sp. TaxID=2291710 RepID=UPI003F8128DE